jgi:YVTN family beta-propeller protein
MSSSLSAAYGEAYQSVICKNNNVNINGLGIGNNNNALGLLTYDLTAQEDSQDEQISVNSLINDERNNQYKLDKNKVLVCLNNNVNRQVGEIPSCKITVDTITGLGNSPAGIAYDSINKRMYVTNFADNTVSVIDTTSNTVIDTIPVGGAPGDIAYDRINQDMYVINEDDNTVSVIDTTSNTVIDTIPVGDLPAGIAYDPINNRMYVINENDSTVSVINLC